MSASAPETATRIPADGLACPACGDALAGGTADGGGPACPGCGTVRPVRDGAVDLLGESARATRFGMISWGRLGLRDEAEVEEYFDDVRRRGWRAATVERCPDPKERRRTLDYMDGPTRADWRFVVDPPPGARILDVGAGLGVHSLHPARDGCRVTATEIDADRARFVALRAAEEGLHASDPSHPSGGWVRPVLAGDTRRMPVQSGAFDLVLLNGVLEWVPTFTDGPPGEVQREFLRECARALRPGGRLWVAIENRFNFGHFLGVPDGHAGLRFTSLMPRTAADWWSRLRKGEPYRTWTHSYDGLRRLLADAGFPRVLRTCPYWGYNQFRWLLDLEDSRPFRGLLGGVMPPPGRRWLLPPARAAAAGPLVRRLVPSFAVLAETSDR